MAQGASDWEEKHARPRPIARLRRLAAGRPIALAAGLLALTSLLFLAAPSLDLAASRLFYSPSSGFPGAGSAALDGIREGARLLEWTLAIAACVPLLLKVVLPDVPILIRPRATLYTIASFALGPGLIVNGILKEHWGRARPRDILEFGGGAGFSPVWWISDQCGHNCSFASGEAASAFWLVAIVFLVPPAWRRPTAIAAVAVAALVSLARMMAGGHFLSDILVAWLLVLLVILLCRALILEALPPGFDTRMEAALARIGRALRHPFGHA